MCVPACPSAGWLCLGILGRGWSQAPGQAREETLSTKPPNPSHEHGRTRSFSLCCYRSTRPRLGTAPKEGPLPNFSDKETGLRKKVTSPKP